MSFDPLDIVRGFDPIDRIEGAISTFLNADWAGAYKKRGAFGILAELASCLTAHNAPTIYVSRDTTWNGVRIEALLKRYGVRIWDRGSWSDQLYFCVKRRQVKWAEYVLIRAGLPVTSGLKESRNTEWAQAKMGVPIPRRRREKKK